MKNKGKRGLAALTALTIAAGGAAFLNKDTKDLTDYGHVEGEFIVKMKQGKMLDDISDKLGPVVRPTSMFWSVDPSDTEVMDDYYHMTTANDIEIVMESIRQDEDVAWVGKNLKVKADLFEKDAFNIENLLGQPNDPMYNKQWGPQMIGNEALHSFLVENNIKPQKKVSVYIIDTGGDEHHEDLKDIYRFIEPAKDGHGHGTHCAGIAAASTNNGVGIASINTGIEGNQYIEVVPIKALTDYGGGSLEGIAEGIVKAADKGADVISMSLGLNSTTPPQVIVDAIEYAQEKGTFVVCSAGNEDSDAEHHYPSAVAGVLSVAATTIKDERAYFSNFGTRVDVGAPGLDILSTVPGKYDVYSGTSMACPQAAGLAALMKAVNKDLKNTDLYDIIRDTAEDIKVDKPIGEGRINALEAVKKAYEMR